MANGGSPINVVRFQNKVRAITGIRGENPMPDLSVFVPGLTVEVDRPEWMFAGGEFLHANSRSTPAGGAGTLASSGLRNPRGSGVIAVIVFVRNTGSVVADLIVGQTQVTGAVDTVVGEISNSPPVAPRDSRMIKADANGIVVSPSALLAFSAQSATGIQGGSFVVQDTLGIGEKLSLANDNFVVVLGPGGFVGLQDQALITASSANWRWYERAQERGILS